MVSGRGRDAMVLVVSVFVLGSSVVFASVVVVALVVLDDSMSTMMLDGVVSDGVALVEIVGLSSLESVVSVCVSGSVSFCWVFSSDSFGSFGFATAPLPREVLSKVSSSPSCDKQSSINLANDAPLSNNCPICTRKKSSTVWISVSKAALNSVRKVFACTNSPLISDKRTFFSNFFNGLYSNAKKEIVEWVIKKELGDCFFMLVMSGTKQMEVKQQTVT